MSRHGHKDVCADAVRVKLGASNLLDPPPLFNRRALQGLFERLSKTPTDLSEQSWVSVKHFPETSKRRRRRRRRRRHLIEGFGGGGAPPEKCQWQEAIGGAEFAIAFAT